MTHAIRIVRLNPEARFQSEFRSLPKDVQIAARKALGLLVQQPNAKSLRLHTLKGKRKPTIWKIDVFTNHSWQITFEMEGDTAVLRRIGTHRDIDRNPR